MSPGDKFAEGVNLIIEGISEAFNAVFENVKELFNNAFSLYINKISQAKNSDDNRVRKAYVIYHRTKSKRIKKKQLKIMLEE